MVLSQEGDAGKKGAKQRKKQNIGCKKATPTKALSLRNFETGLGPQSGKRFAQPSGGIYRRLSFSRRKTNRTSFLAVSASARLCWYLLTSLNLRS